MTTGFFWDEKCFWHAGGAYALTLPLGEFVQPLAAGGLPENPETKRRLKNLMSVSGIDRDLAMQSAPPATWGDLARVHPETFLKKFKETSDAGGGELGARLLHRLLVGREDLEDQRVVQTRIESD